MSCWVTPEVAAEWWSIAVEQVHAGVQAGTIPCKQEIGRLFVDVAPDSPQMSAPQEDSDESMGDWKIGREQTSQRRKRAA